MTMDSEFTRGDANPPLSASAAPARRSLSVWHVTAAAALIVFALLAFSLYRLDRTAVTVADVATGTTPASSLQAQLGSTKPEPATPAPAEQAARTEAPPPPQRDQGRLGPIIQGLLNPTPAPVVETAPAAQAPAARIEQIAPVPPRSAEPAPPSALEAALARAEAAAAGSAEPVQAVAPLTVGARLPEPAAGPSVAPAAPSASGAMRVFLHFTAGDPDERDKAERLARELRRRGVTVADIRPVRQSVRSSMIRFYHDSDRAQLGLLASALADAAGNVGTPDSWYISDFTRYSAPPRAGNVEVWIPNG